MVQAVWLKKGRISHSRDFPIATEFDARELGWGKNHAHEPEEEQEDHFPHFAPLLPHAEHHRERRRDHQHARHEIRYRGRISEGPQVGTPSFFVWPP